MKFGVHISTAGNLAGTPARAKAMGAEAIQIFAGSPRTWKQATYTKDQAAAFRKACDDLAMPAFIHMMYLTSYGTPDKQLRRLSINSAKQTMTNADQLGIKGVITHLGSHKGAGTAAVLDDLRAALLEVVDATNSRLLLEDSAGAGGSIGNSIEELALIYEAVDRNPKIGFCLDTCHLFTSGYEVRTAKDWGKVLDEFDDKIGLNQLDVLHLNDSKGDLSSKRDRHENIGDGFIGDVGFRGIINHSKVQDVPGILEVPGLDGKGPDEANLEKLRSLAKP